MLYEVAIIEKPTQKEREAGKGERLVFGPKAVCASSEQTAGILASREASLDDVKVDQLEVLVRPFAVKK